MHPIVKLSSIFLLKLITLPQCHSYANNQPALLRRKILGVKSRISEWSFFQIVTCICYYWGVGRMQRVVSKVMQILYTPTWGILETPAQIWQCSVCLCMSNLPAVFPSILILIRNSNEILWTCVVYEESAGIDTWICSRMSQISPVFLNACIWPNQIKHELWV